MWRALVSSLGAAHTRCTSRPALVIRMEGAQGAGTVGTWWRECREGLHGHCPLWHTCAGEATHCILEVNLALDGEKGQR